jgi:ubiquinone/menaquinone biosynthesis C-methylase UbiE
MALLMDISEKRKYHLAELVIAQSIGDPRRVMPQFPSDGRRVLDIGCGAGQSLIAACLSLDVLAVGVDKDIEALRIGRELSSRICFVCSSGETLPFQDNTFDFVLSRVALPYMNIPRALDEIARVLIPGGQIWIVLHSAKMSLRHLLNAVRSLDLKATIFQCYVLIAGSIFHATGRTIRFPFSSGRYESFQTRSRIVKALVTRGFTRIEIPEGRFFVVSGEKRTDLST